MNKIQTVSILGTPYRILFRKTKDDPILGDTDGYTDQTAKKIVIGEKDPDCDLENFEVYQRQVIRHEIVHAYFMESGLHASLENKPQGVPEMYVDWFAIQAPKIFETFDELGVLETMNTNDLLDALCNNCFGASMGDCDLCEEERLTGNEYQRLAMRTCNIPYDKKDDMLRHAVFGLASEAGEVAGIMQKIYQGHPFDKEHVKKELGDCLWMIAEACQALGFSMNSVMKLNIDKLKARYPEGFSTEKSLHRKDGDI